MFVTGLPELPSGGGIVLRYLPVQIRATLKLNNELCHVQVQPREVMFSPTLDILLCQLFLSRCSTVMSAGLFTRCSFLSYFAVSTSGSSGGSAPDSDSAESAAATVAGIGRVDFVGFVDFVDFVGFVGFVGFGDGGARARPLGAPGLAEGFVGLPRGTWASQDPPGIMASM